MNEEERTEKFKKIFEKTLTKLAENPDELFDNHKLQRKYNNLLKEQIKLKQELDQYKNNWEELRKYINEYIESEKDGASKYGLFIDKEIEKIFDNDIFLFNKILNKMKELEEKNNDNN